MIKSIDRNTIHGFINDIGFSDAVRNKDYVIVRSGERYSRNIEGQHREHFNDYYVPNHVYGASYVGGMGCISPGNGVFDVLVCDEELFDKACEKLSQDSDFGTHTVGVKVFNGGRDVVFENKELDEAINQMWERNYQKFHELKAAREKEQFEKIKRQEELKKQETEPENPKLKAAKMKILRTIAKDNVSSPKHSVEEKLNIKLILDSIIKGIND